MGCDKVLLFVTLCLLSLGLVMVYSASQVLAYDQRGDSLFFLKRQLLYMALGLAALIIANYTSYRLYSNLGKPLLLVAGVLLLLVYSTIGVKLGGSRRWIQISEFTFQPVELVKLALIIYTASFLERKSDKIRSLSRGLLPSLLALFFFFLALYYQPDFGSVVLLTILALAMLFIGGARISQILILALAASLFLYFQMKAEDYRLSRWLSFLNPWSDPEGSGYQIIQSFYALSSGGILGLGIGAGSQKLFYLPAAHTDFIFSIIGEELGLVGGLLTIGLYAVFVWRGIRIGLAAKDTFGSLLAMGISCWVGLQAAVNVAVTLGLLPTKGLTLPYISFGGSSLVAVLFATGILLNISKTESEVK
jgi:cell division protein FtsW